MGLCVASFVAGCLVYIIFGHLNKTEDAMNTLDSDITEGPERKNSEVTY